MEVVRGIQGILRSPLRVLADLGEREGVRIGVSENLDWVEGHSDFKALSHKA